MGVKIDIISGFLGVGKTTFLNKILSTQTEKTVVIENEFGDVGIDANVLQGEVPVREIASGCICCGLVGEFQDAIESIVESFKPESIIIEPSGIGRPGDIMKVCEVLSKDKNIDLEVRRIITIVDVLGFEDSIDSFGFFYREQIQSANIIFLSYLREVDKLEKDKIINMIKKENSNAVIIEDDWYDFDGRHLKDILELTNTIDTKCLEKKKSLDVFSTNYIFTSLSLTYINSIEENRLKEIVKQLDREEFGKVLRAKGIIKISDGDYIYFNYTPYHFEYQKTLEKESKAVFIGCNLNKEELKKAFSKGMYN